jgi:hypothetical protein
MPRGHARDWLLAARHLMLILLPAGACPALRSTTDWPTTAALGLVILPDKVTSTILCYQAVQDGRPKRAAIADKIACHVSGGRAIADDIGPPMRRIHPLPTAPLQAQASTGTLRARRIAIPTLLVHRWWRRSAAADVGTKPLARSAKIDGRFRQL